MLWSSVVLLAFGQLPLRTAPQITTNPLASPSVSFAWSPSPDNGVTGYYLCWGLGSGVCTNRLDVGNSTSAAVVGLTPNVTYYFSAIGHNGSAGESAPSNEVSYSPAKLGADLQTNSSLRLNFQAVAEGTYLVQATTDLQHWNTLWTTNCAADGLIVFDVMNVAGNPIRFFRLQRE